MTDAIYIIDKWDIPRTCKLLYTTPTGIEVLETDNGQKLRFKNGYEMGKFWKRSYVITKERYLELKADHEKELKLNRIIKLAAEIYNSSRDIELIKRNIYKMSTLVEGIVNVEEV